jgi:ATP-binding protein involved in chromosome partitioning
MAQQGAKVGLMDADIYGPNIPMMMGINDKPRQAANGKIAPLEK